MKQCKNLNIIFSSAKPGVTVIEAIIALLIITIMLGVLLASQGNSLRVGVSTMLEQTIIQALDQRFVEIDKNHLDARKQTITSALQAPLPPGTIEYTVRRPSDDSSLRNFKGLYIETLTARWSNRGRDVTTQLVRLHTYPTEQNDVQS
jgi:hypothetical protein